MTLLEILLIIIVFLLSFIAIKITLQFDINDFLKERRKIRVNQLKNICPHNTVSLENEQFIIRSLFSSPVGTVNWICSQCGLIVSSQEDTQRLMQSNAENPEQIMKGQKEFIKQAKKLKIV